MNSKSKSIDRSFYKIFAFLSMSILLMLFCRLAFAADSTTEVIHKKVYLSHTIIEPYMVLAGSIYWNERGPSNSMFSVQYWS